MQVHKWEPKPQMTLEQWKEKYGISVHYGEDGCHSVYTYFGFDDSASSDLHNLSDYDCERGYEEYILSPK